MAIIQVFIAITTAAEKVQQLTILIIVGDILGAIAIGNEEIAIVIYRSFSWHELFSFFVDAGFQRHVDSH